MPRWSKADQANYNKAYHAALRRLGKTFPSELSRLLEEERDRGSYYEKARQRALSSLRQRHLDIFETFFAQEQVMITQVVK